MITLEQAIELATKAHKGQWRKKQNATVKEYSIPRKEIVHSGSHYIIENDAHLFEDTEDEQVWKILYPYITHPLAVMEMMDTEEEKIVAVLHDLFEETEYVLTDGKEGSWVHLPNELEEAKLAMQWLPNKIVCALDYLTKDKVSSYDDYIKNLAQDKLSTKVKLADIVHNLSCNPSEHAKDKYLKAMPILLKGL